VTILSTYEAQVADLLHDPGNNSWSVAQLDNYINEARRKLVMDTGCLRQLQQTYLTPVQEQYTFGQVTGAIIGAAGTRYTAPTVAFAGGGGTGVAATLGVSAGAVNTITFTNFGSGYTSAPTATIMDGTGTGAVITPGVLSYNTYDVIGVSVLWGTQRYPLDWMPFSKLSAWLRQWLASTYTRQPAAWSAYGNTSVFIGPPPDQSYPTEFDTVVLPTALADYVTNDPIPIVAQDPIKFYAAGLAKFNNQSFGEAEKWFEFYRLKMLEVSAAYTRRIPSNFSQ
jgi:hypothetical protein